MELKTYRRKSNQVQVQAFEFVPGLENIPESEVKHILSKEIDGNLVYFTEHPNRSVLIFPGNILVKRASGYLYPFSKAVFETEYELVEELVEDV